METLLTHNEQELRNTISETAQSEIAPFVIESDRESKYPQKVYEILRSLGLFIEPCPQDSLSKDELGILIRNCMITAEELGAVCPGLASIFTIHCAASIPLLLLSRENGSYNKKFFSKSHVLGFELLSVGYQPGSSEERTTYLFEKDDKKKILLSGRSTCFIPGVMKNSARNIIVFARDGSDRPENGKSEDNNDEVVSGNDNRKEEDCTAFVISLESENISIGDREELLGLCVQQISELNFNNYRISGSDMLGGEGQGKKLKEYIEIFSRFFAAALSLGIIRNAYKISKKYSEERKQFGQKIGSFQAIEDMFVDMQIAIKVGNNLLYDGIEEIFYELKRAGISSAIAKLNVTGSAVVSATDAVQICGGYGYMRDFPIEKLMRDAKMLQVLHGAPHFLKRLLAQKL